MSIRWARWCSALSTSDWHQVMTPGAVVPALAPPGSNGTEPRMDAVPALGEHTRSILTELGLSSEEVTALVADGVV